MIESSILVTYLPVIWALLIATAVALYVILDGFDLGIGILFPTAKEEKQRDQMMNSIAPSSPRGSSSRRTAPGSSCTRSGCSSSTTSGPSAPRACRWRPRAG